MQKILADIILCENICKTFLKELDNGNDKNISSVTYFLNSLDNKMAHLCFRQYFELSTVIKFDLDENNDFFNFIMKINNLHFKNEDDYNDFHIFFLKRKLINNPNLTKVTHPRFKKENKNIIVSRLQNNEFKVVIEE